jgi:vitamin B12 transporter
MKFIVAVSSSFLLTAPAWAQQDTDTDTPSLVDPPIVVTGALPEPMGDTAYTITRVDLASEASGRVENALRNVPGLQQFRRSDARSANPTSQGVTLRGLGGNASSRALLLLDDVPQSDPFGGWVSWPGYDALNLASMRVRRGGGTGSDGPGALAGTIALESGRIYPDQSIVYGDFAFGSRDSIDAHIGTKQALGAGGLAISANYARGDGFIPIAKSARGAVDRGAQYEQAGISARFVAPLSQDTEVQANMRAFTDERDRGFDFSDNTNDGVDASLRIVSNGRWKWSATGYVQVRSFSTRFGSISDDRNMVSLVLDQFNVPSTGLGARFELRPPVGDEMELRIGGDWRRTIGETRENFFFIGLDPQRNRVAGGKSDTLGGFIEGSWQASDTLMLTGGGRVDYWSIHDGFRREIELVNPAPGTVRSDEQFADRNNWEGTGRLGFAWNAASLLTFRGAGYLGWRLPTLNELYRPFRVGADATAANELLAPERLKGAELGLDYEIYTLRLGATLFYNRLDNAIANVTLANGPGNFPGVGFVSGAGTYSQRQNLDNVRSLGVEFDAAADIGAVGVRIGYSYVDSEVRGTPAQAGLDGLRPAQVPRHFASATVDWFPGGGESGASITGRYIGSQFDDDANVQRLNDALTIDGRAAYRISKALLVEARVENLFDARIETAIIGPGVVERASPRTFWLGVKIDLD